MTALPGGTVGLISNPASGHNRDQFERIRRRIDACRPIHHIVTREASEIPQALSRLRDAGVGILGINGGDGTISATLGLMLEAEYFSSNPAIVVLPGGTANMNAGDVGITGALPRAVQRFCRWCEAPNGREQRVHRRLMRVARSGYDAPAFGMFLGAGAVIQGTEFAHREIHARGLRDDFSLALGTLRTVWGLARGHSEFNDHQRIALTLDRGTSREHDVRILAISTLHRLAFGMRPFWAQGPGALRLTLMERNCTRFARTFVGIARGRPGANAVPEQGYFSHNADTVRLDMDGRLNLDGEILDASGSVTVTATPALEFIRL